MVGHFFGHLTTVEFPSSFGGAENLPHMDVLAGNYLLKGVLSPQGILCSRSFWGLQLFSLPCRTLQHTCGLTLLSLFALYNPPPHSLGMAAMSGRERQEP